MSKHDDDETEDQDEDGDEVEDTDDSDVDLDDSDDTPDEDDSDDDHDDDEEENDDSEDDAGEQTVASAAPHEVEAHRNLIGTALQHLTDQGVDVESLAEQAGISSAAVEEMTHGDLAGLTKFLGEHHPDALQDASDDHPEGQGLLHALSTGGGFLGRLFGR